MGVNTASNQYSHSGPQDRLTRWTHNFLIQALVEMIFASLENSQCV